MTFNLPSLITRSLFVFWIAAICLASIVNYSAFLGEHSAVGGGSGYVPHAIGYFIAGALCHMAFPNRSARIFFMILAIFSMGVALEVVQFYVPGRSFNPKDILSNGLGLFGFYVLRMIYGKIRRSEVGDHPG